MRKIALTTSLISLILCLINFGSIADDSANETELNVFTGMFDFSDEKQSSNLFGLQHQNNELFRNSFFHCFNFFIVSVNHKIKAIKFKKIC